MAELLQIVADLMLGGRHSRRTIVKAARVSLPTADRWIALIRDTVPGMRTTRIGKVTWIEWPEAVPKK